MKAARSARSTRAILTAALLCGLAACTRDPERQEAAAASSAASSPAAKPDYMTEHIARDAVLSDALIGTWSETEIGNNGTPLVSITRYEADHTLSAVVTDRNKPAQRYRAKGTWSIAQGYLVLRWMLEGYDKVNDNADEILRIDKNEFVHVDGDDKKTKIATRVADGALAAAAAAPQPAVPAPTPSVAAAAQEDPPFVDDTLFVAGDDVGVHAFRVNATTQIRLSVEIDEKVPVNVIVQRGQVAPEEYVMRLGVLMLGQVFAPFDDGKGEKASTTDDLFKSRLSKRAAYGRFASPWVTLPAGLYTVILDNSGQLSPSRGDAPVHLRLYSRPVQ